MSVSPDTVSNPSYKFGDGKAVMIVGGKDVEIGTVRNVSIETSKPAQSHTYSDYRAALHDSETPQAVKRAIKQHLHGSPGGRRGVRTQFTTSHRVHPLVPSDDPKRPAGVSGRQWKRERKAVRRIVKIVNERLG